jgi:hypothetical protein
MQPDQALAAFNRLLLIPINDVQGLLFTTASLSQQNQLVTLGAESQTREMRRECRTASACA